METTFADIRITALDVDATRPSPQGPGMRLLHLKLSDLPPPNWVRLFNELRQQPRHSMWRQAWIEGSHVVIDCVPDEIEQYHLTDLKDDVRVCNGRHRRWDQEMAIAETARRREEQSERIRLIALNARLDFD